MLRDPKSLHNRYIFADPMGYVDHDEQGRIVNLACERFRYPMSGIGRLQRMKSGFVTRAGAFWACMALVCAMTAANRALALPPPVAKPWTVWNYLGIPQGMQKIRDATSNRRGNRPNRERKPPLKAIADPANLESDNSAIAKAAKIKTEEDMAPQKIKAIKYLATIGCGCYPDVSDALMDALDDCTEEVRYQAALAIEDATNLHCSHCNTNCCCDEKLVKKLAKVAYEKNDKGCPEEVSERVREAAIRAMCGCCQNPGPAEPQEELPTPALPRPEGTPDDSPEDEAPRSAGRPAEAGYQRLSDTGRQDAGYQRLSDSGRYETKPRVVVYDAPSPAGQEEVDIEEPEMLPAKRDRAEAQPAKTIASQAPPLRQPIRLTAGLSTASGSGGQPMAVSAVYVSEVQDNPNPQTQPLPMSGKNVRHAPPLSAVLKGVVARVSAASNTVEVRIESAGKLRAGDRLKVTHEYLRNEVIVGYLEVVAVGDQAVTARPVSGLKLGKIARGDEVTFRTGGPIAVDGPPQRAAARDN